MKIHRSHKCFICQKPIAEVEGKIRIVDAHRHVFFVHAKCYYKMCGK